MKAAHWGIAAIAAGVLLAMAGLCRLPLGPLRSSALAIISAFGVTANFSGGVLLWVYGIPNRVNRDGHIVLRIQPISEEMKKLARFYDLMSNLGLALLVAGFIIQLLAPLCS
jgi:hypothetical protein